MRKQKEVAGEGGVGWEVVLVVRPLWAAAKFVAGFGGW